MSTTSAANTNVRELAPGLSVIDLGFQGTPGVIASYLLTGKDEAALVETGPGSTLPQLLTALDAAGVDPEQVTKLIVTHIHLDHAGAAGTLLKRFPRARLVVHSAGAAHMADPSKLLASATRIYGDAMDRLWGEFLPVPADRMDVVDDGAEIRAAGRTLRAVYTPGHASHHIALHDAERGLVFTGDVGGVRLGTTPYVCPPTPPPDIDLALWRESVGRLRALRPRQLLLTHFGAFDDAAWHLDDLLARLHYRAGWQEGRATAGVDAKGMAGELSAMQRAELAAVEGDAAPIDGYELATPSWMSVDGITRWIRKRERI